MHVFNFISSLTLSWGFRWLGEFSWHLFVIGSQSSQHLWVSSCRVARVCPWPHLLSLHYLITEWAGYQTLVAMPTKHCAVPSSQTLLLHPLFCILEWYFISKLRFCSPLTKFCLSKNSSLGHLKAHDFLGYLKDGSSNSLQQEKHHFFLFLNPAVPIAFSDQPDVAELEWNHFKGSGP